MNGNARAIGLIAGQDIVLLGGGDWDLCPREPDLLTVLAPHGNRVLFLESAGMRRPDFHVQDLRRIVARLGRAREGMKDRGPGIHVISPLTIPLPDLALARAVNVWIQRWALHRAMRRLAFRDPILWVTSPLFEPLIERIPAKLVIYDCFDEWTAFPGVDAALFGRLEARAIRRSDLVLAASQQLVEAKRGLRPDVRLLRNGVHVERFQGSEPPEPADLAGIPRPRIGYVGNIYGRLDLAGLEALARARPDWSLVLVGLVRTPIDSLAALPNVHVLGHRPKALVSDYLRHLDVGVVAHVPSALADRQDPTKIYEYLAAGLPVVTTDLPAIEPFGPWVRRVPFGGDWAAAIAAELAADAPDARRARREEASRHSWEARARDLSGWIEEALAAKRRAPHA
ncbi:MAG: glycosyltransferase [bacterium]